MPCRASRPEPYKGRTVTILEERSARGTGAYRGCQTCGTLIEKPNRKCDGCRTKGINAPSNNVGHNERLYRANRLHVLTACRNHDIGCALCGKPFDFDAAPRTPLSFTIDHIIPRSKGGSHDDLANMQPAHHSCNSARGDRELDVITAQRTDPKSEDWP
jgi:5-methylcytosine-specific restriction endonuclease McrA